MVKHGFFMVPNGFLWLQTLFLIVKNAFFCSRMVLRKAVSLLMGTVGLFALRMVLNGGSPPFLHPDANPGALFRF